MKRFASHGTGAFDRGAFRTLGENVILENGVLVFHPEQISIGDNVYVGHYAILKGYYRNEMRISSNVWIGQQCFLHSAGGLTIEDNVGIGPGVRILTARHADRSRDDLILFGAPESAPVTLASGCNIGVGAVILPGVRVGRGAQIGAGAVVNRSVPDFAVAVGVPARVVKMRPA